MEKNIRECENFNHNLRINAYVLMTKSGKAWARGVLGEDNIRRWQRAYDACCKRGGFLPEKIPKSGAKTKLAPRKAPKSYEWKPIALPKLSGLFFASLDLNFPDLPDPFAKNIFAWPREKRVLTPAIFWPYELEDDYVEEHDYIFCYEQPSYERVQQNPDSKTEPNKQVPGSSPGTEKNELKPP